MWYCERGLWRWAPRYHGALPGVVASQGGGAAPVAAPTINGAESFFGDIDALTSHDVNLTGQSFTAGDMALMCASLRAQDISTLAGDTDDTYAEVISERSVPSTYARIAVWQGTISGALDAVATMTLPGSSRIAGGLVTISGAGASPNASDADNGNSASPASPDILTTVDNCLILTAFGALGGHEVTTIEAGVPTDFTIVSAQNSESTSETATTVCSIGVAAKVQASAGQTGVITWTNALDATQEWAAVTIAIPPTGS